MIVGKTTEGKDFILREDAETITFNGEPTIKLTRKQVELIKVLAASKELLNDKALYKKVWDLDFVPVTGPLRVTIHNINKRVGFKLIISKKSFGFSI